MAVKNVKSVKPSGMGSMSPRITPRGPRNYFRLTSKGYKGQYNLGTTLRAWRRTEVVFITKAGKRDHFQPIFSDYVAWHHFYWKFGMLWDNYIRNNVRNPLDSSRQAYRTGHSTKTVLDQLTDVLWEAIAEKDIFQCAFLGFEGVFNNTSSEKRFSSLDGQNVGKQASRNTNRSKFYCHEYNPGLSAGWGTTSSYWAAAWNCALIKARPP